MTDSYFTIYKGQTKAPRYRQMCRWEKEIEEQEYLKLFNTLLYICDEYDYWAEVIRYERDNLVFFGG